jgi:hypothetical protein
VPRQEALAIPPTVETVRRVSVALDGGVLEEAVDEGSWFGEVAAG